MREVAAHGLDQVRDQVVPAAQLHVDLREGVLEAVAEPDEPVEEHDQADHRGGGEGKDKGVHGVGAMGSRYRRLRARSQPAAPSRPDGPSVTPAFRVLAAWLPD